MHSSCQRKKENQKWSAFSMSLFHALLSHYTPNIPSNFSPLWSWALIMPGCGDDRPSLERNALWGWGDCLPSLAYLFHEKWGSLDRFTGLLFSIFLLSISILEYLLSFFRPLSSFTLFLLYIFLGISGDVFPINPLLRSGVELYLGSLDSLGEPTVFLIVFTSFVKFIVVLTPLEQKYKYSHLIFNVKYFMLQNNICQYFQWLRKTRQKKENSCYKM